MEINCVLTHSASLFDAPETEAFAVEKYLLVSKRLFQTCGRKTKQHQELNIQDITSKTIHNTL